MKGTSRTIVFVGGDAHLSYWVPQEVTMTLEANKPVYAIRLATTHGRKPQCLQDYGIELHGWSEKLLQHLATC